MMDCRLNLFTDRSRVHKHQTSADTSEVYIKETARGNLQATKAPSRSLAHGLGSVRFPRVGFDVGAKQAGVATRRPFWSGADSAVAHQATGTGGEAEGTVERGDQPASPGAAIDGP